MQTSEWDFQMHVGLLLIVRAQQLADLLTARVLHTNGYQ